MDLVNLLRTTMVSGAVLHFALVVLATYYGITMDGDYRRLLQRHRILSRINLVVLAATVVALWVLPHTGGVRWFGAILFGVYVGIHYWMNGIKHPEIHGGLVMFPTVASFFFMIVVFNT